MATGGTPLSLTQPVAPVVNSQAATPFESLLETSSLSLGANHSCTIANDTPWCWGYNASGQTGVGGSINNAATPVPGFDTDVTLVRSGNSFSCAVTSPAGEVYCWGSNADSKSGVSSGNNTTVSTPVKILDEEGDETPLVGVTALDLGSQHGCAVRGGDWSVWCWGSNTMGQLGNGLVGGSQHLAAQVLLEDGQPLVGVEGLGLGHDRSCAYALAHDQAWCWGSDSHGSLGNGAALGATSHAGTVLNLTSVVSLTSGENHTCALRADGRVMCWGRDDVGQLGNNSAESKEAPWFTTDFGTVLAVDTEWNTTCAVLDDQTAWCWGQNNFSQIGDGIVQRWVPSPVWGFEGLD